VSSTVHTRIQRQLTHPCSYTKADNSVIVATDSIKNTIYITARQNPVTPPELFGSILGTHFIEKYNHIHAAHVNIITHRWERMDVDGKPHPHSFIQPGAETRDVQVDVVEGKGIAINSAIKGLTVLKSTGSQFWGFLRDEYTTLKETWDRILSTDVAANWQWRQFANVAEVKADVGKFNAAYEAARKITLKTFAEDVSASVQATMYKMGEQILAAAPLLETVEYSLPNKHYFEIGTFSDCYLFSWMLQALGFWTNRCAYRSLLAQRPQEHWQGRRGLCS
jgi:urate oxidase